MLPQRAGVQLHVRRHQGNVRLFGLYLLRQFSREERLIKTGPRVNLCEDFFYRSITYVMVLRGVGKLILLKVVRSIEC